MKKLIAVLIITFSLLIIVLTQARAESKNKDKENEHKNQIQNVSITSTPQTTTIEKRDIGKTITQVKVEGIGKDHPKWKGFETKGNISNLSFSSFDINGKTITMDATITGKLQIKGALANDAFVKVEGKLIDGTYYAKEVKVETKDEDENDDNNPIFPTVAPSVSPTPEATASPTPTPQLNNRKVRFGIYITGPIEEVIKAIENLLGFLKSTNTPA